MAAKIAHEELRGEYLAAWRARFERLVSGVERAGRRDALTTTVPSEDGQYRWPEAEDDSEKRLIAVVRRLLQLRLQSYACVFLSILVVLGEGWTTGCVTSDSNSELQLTVPANDQLSENVAFLQHHVNQAAR